MIPLSKTETTKFNHKAIHKKGSKMLLNVDNVYRITEKIAFPRLVGSAGEKKAIKIVVDEFKRAGYDSVNRDDFMTSLYDLDMDIKSNLDFIIYEGEKKGKPSKIIDLSNKVKIIER